VLIDELMPRWDATRMDHRVVDGPPDLVYEAAMRADFAEAFSQSAVARGLVGLRTVIERALRAIRGASPVGEAPAERLTLSGMPDHGQNVLLGEDPTREVAFGMIGRFWPGETRWEELDASEFAGFDRPGLARIACNLSFRDYGPGRTLVSYETRTQATDDSARRAFLRYWRVAGPLAGFVLRAQLKTMAKEARRLMGQHHPEPDH
jgi:hypothetical protein